MAKAGLATFLMINEAEWDVATVRTDGKLVLHSRVHKTSTSYGLATLVLEGTDAYLFKLCLSKVRPTVQSDSESVLDTGKGCPLTHYRDLATSLCHKCKLPDLPTPTQV